MAPTGKSSEQKAAAEPTQQPGEAATQVTRLEEAKEEEDVSRGRSYGKCFREVRHEFDSA